MQPHGSQNSRRLILCYVTDRKTLQTGDAQIIEKIGTAVQAGADWVQIREKDLTTRELLALTRRAVQAAEAAAQPVRIIVNDRLDIAIAAGASGVHLGSESIPVRELAAWRGAGNNAPKEFVIGYSCHQLKEAIDAEKYGASYVFFGPIYDTPSKRAFGAPQGVARLGEVCRALRIPVLAIGGVKEENADELMGAGCAGIAAIRLFQEAETLWSLQETLAGLHRLPLR